MRTKDFRPVVLYNMSVIVPLSSTDDIGWSGDETSWGLWRWLEEFREELVFSTAYVASPIRVVLSYTPDKSAGQPDSATQQLLFDSFCTKVNDFFLEMVPDVVGTDTITVQCIFFESSAQMDVRELAARFAYKTWNTDFYLLADTRFPWTSPGWTCRLLWRASWKALMGTTFLEDEDMALGAPQGEGEESLLHDIALYPNDSVRLVLTARQHLWGWFNSDVFANNPIVWRAASNDSIGPDDKLYHYCRLTNTCPEAGLTDEGKRLLFWRDTLHLPRSFICSFENVHARLWASLSVDTSALCRDEAVENLTGIDWTFSTYYPNELYEQPGAKVAVITAVFGDYELTGKPFPRQTIPTDFLLFSDRPPENITAPGWIIVNTPYHVLQFQEEQDQEDTRELHNALHRHTHPFNVAKFYKQSFHKIPMLRKYDVVIWIDGTVVITDASMSLRMMGLLTGAVPQHVMAVFEHHRRGQLEREVNASTVGIAVSKYSSDFWGGYTAITQDIVGQYETYLKEGHPNPHHSERAEFGLWCTCFVAWNMRHERTASVLDMWYRHNLQYTTQDQVSFPVVLQRLNVTPLSLPDGRIDIYGTFTANTMFFKYFHGF
eukprot:gene4440-3173_t